MRTYGLIKFGMRGCCAGHDELPRDSYNSPRSKRSRRNKTKRARRRERRLIRMTCKSGNF